MARAGIAVVDMRIAWCSIDALTEAVEVFDPTALVSIWSPLHPIRDIGDRPQLHLPMHDIEERSLRTCDKVAPDRPHMRAFLELLEHKPDRLLIHCTAGLSRSPAFAIVAAVKAGHDPVDVCAEVHRQLAHAQPNRLILQIADEIFRIDMLSAAMSIFRYDRGQDHPAGERAGLCELELATSCSEVAG